MSRQVIQLQSDELSLEFEPERGGKWRSLCDRRTGVEWFWKNPYLSPVQLVYGDSFIEKHDTGGWDEIFPSVEPCELPGFGSVPDHGDLVQLPWKVDKYDSTHLAMSLNGRCWPYRFQRDVILEGGEIRCEYRLTNTGTEAFPWLWCAHPLLAIPAGLELEQDAKFDVIYASGAAGALVGDTVMLSDLPQAGGAPWAAKLFSERGAVDSITARHENGGALRFEWDANEIPFLGLWLNHGDWSGCNSEPYQNVGIEPAMLAVDDLSAAQNPLLLEPQETRNWSLRVSVI